MVDVTISLVGSNGDSITLADDGDFVLATGVTGFGIPTTAVRIDESAGDGGTWRHTRRGIREMDLPLVILGNSRTDVETKLRRISRLLQDRKGPTKIVANYSDGSSVYIEAHYVGGAETEFGDSANSYFCRWAIQLQAPNPYWKSGTVSSFSVTTGSTGRGLLPNLTKLKVSSSQTLGVVSVNNAGDVDAFPKWVIRGPVKDLVVSDGTYSFSYPGLILGGTSVTIDTASGEVYDDQGVNVYSKLGTAPKLFSLAPGVTNISVIGTEATADTSIVCYYSPRYEVIH